MVYLRHMSHIRFLKMLKETTKGIVLLCAGKRMYEVYDTYCKNNNVICALDNYKCGEVIRLGDTNVEICSFADAGREIRKAVLILTTVRYIREIIEQLDNIKIFDNLEIYVPDLFTVDDTHWQFKKGKELIPKTIHYCWFGKNKLPEAYEYNIKTWKEMCPEYEIIRWDESNYDITKNIYMHQAYKHGKWGFVPDYARLDILYNYGGIYLDTDVEVLKSYNSLLAYDMFCGYENSNFINLGLGFGARPGHPVIKKLIDRYEKIYFENEDGSLNLVASPVLQTDTFKNMGFNNDGYTKEFKDVLVLSTMYLAPLTSSGIGCPNSESFSIHQYEATWFSEEKKQWKIKHKEFGEFVNSRMRYE